MAELADHQHGKSKVRLARTWRVGEKHYFVEWSVSTMLESDMAHAFLHGSNADMTATDTQRNMVSSLRLDDYRMALSASALVSSPIPCHKRMVYRNKSLPTTFVLQVYFVAKQCARPCTLETYAEELARAFVKEYPKVTLQLPTIWLTLILTSSDGAM